MKALKIIGFILIMLQAVSLFPALVSGDNILENGIINLCGRLIFGIIGVILLLIAYLKKKPS